MSTDRPAGEAPRTVNADDLLDRIRKADTLFDDPEHIAGSVEALIADSEAAVPSEPHRPDPLICSDCGTRGEIVCARCGGLILDPPAAPSEPSRLDHEREHWPHMDGSGRWCVVCKPGSAAPSEPLPVCRRCGEFMSAPPDLCTATGNRQSCEVAAPSGLSEDTSSGTALSLDVESVNRVRMLIALADAVVDSVLRKNSGHITEGKAHEYRRFRNEADPFARLSQRPTGDEE